MVRAQVTNFTYASTLKLPLYGVCVCVCAWRRSTEAIIPPSAAVSQWTEEEKKRCLPRLGIIQNSTSRMCAIRRTEHKVTHIRTQTQFVSALAMLNAPAMWCVWRVDTSEGEQTNTRNLYELITNEWMLDGCMLHEHTHANVCSRARAGCYCVYVRTE